MNHLLSVAILLGVLILSTDYVLSNFRKNIKQGDQVGVRFGDFVVNREVHRVSGDFVMVKDRDLKRLIEVKKEDVFVSDSYSPRDEAVESEVN